MAERAWVAMAADCATCALVLRVLPSWGAVPTSAKCRNCKVNDEGQKFVSGTIYPPRNASPDGAVEQMANDGTAALQPMGNGQNETFETFDRKAMQMPPNSGGEYVTARIRGANLTFHVVSRRALNASLFFWHLL
jgi:hypothetical protein